MYRFAYVFTYVTLFTRAFSYATYERNLAVAFSVVTYVPIFFTAVSVFVLTYARHP